MIATSQLPGRTVSVWLLLTHLSSSSSQTPMKTIQALCVSSPLNPWLPSQPTPTPPLHPTAKTLWSSTGRWVCTHTNTHTHMYIMYTLKALLHSTVRWVHSVYSVGRAKTRTSSSQVTQIHTVQQHLVAVYSWCFMSVILKQGFLYPWGYCCSCQGILAKIVLYLPVLIS